MPQRINFNKSKTKKEKIVAGQCPTTESFLNLLRQVPMEERIEIIKNLLQKLEAEFGEEILTAVEWILEDKWENDGWDFSVKTPQYQTLSLSGKEEENDTI